ncbi:ABC transporter permease [Sorangium sp. So ce131]|uniref:ABC transporter permease n=1 Tax=Sorangium sp. So ce131 TaxID=3133282 RepID=UPI003F6181D0
MYRKTAMPASLLALAAMGAGCNLIFGIEPGAQETSSTASTGAEGGLSATSSAGGNGAASGGGGAGGADGGMGSCPRPSCVAGECSVTPVIGEFGHNAKGMVVAGDFVLLANSDTIVSIPRDGGAAGPLLGTAGFGDPAWVAYAEGKLYWSNWSNAKVFSISIDPPSTSAIQVADVPPQDPMPQSAFGRLAADRDHIYWATQVPEALWRAKSDGSEIYGEKVAEGSPIGIAVDETHIYWSDYDGRQILRTTKDPLGSPERFAETNGAPATLVLSKGVVYWLTEYTGAIQSKRTDAQLAAPPFTITVDPDAVPASIAVDDEFVYWTVATNTNEDQRGEVKRSPLGVGNPVTLATGASYFFEIAVDCGYIYWNINDLNNEEPTAVFRMPKPSN